MGAMLVGMATGIAAMIFSIVVSAVIALILFIDARRHKMKALNWAIAGLLFNFWVVPVYIIARIRLATLKCKVCGAKVGPNVNFCLFCGAAVEKPDDGNLAKRFVIYAVGIMAGIIAVGTVYTIIVDVLV